MRFRDLGIGKQLFAAFAVMLFFMFAMGLISRSQTELMHKQTEDLYNHSLRVHRHLSTIETGVLEMRLATRDLMLSTNHEEAVTAIHNMDLAASRIERSFEMLTHIYTGPHENIDNAYDAFIQWNTSRRENTQFASEGELEKVKDSVSPTGTVGKLREAMLDQLDALSKSSMLHTDELYNNSLDTKKELELQLFLLLFVVILLSIVIGLFLRSGIRTPIKELSNVIDQFRDGNLEVRSTIKTSNEFGVLSDTFNQMISTIADNIELTNKTALIANSMLVVENSHRFFQDLLPVLMDLTGSQIAAVYLLSPDKTEFYEYESVGLSARDHLHSFSVKEKEGEFGAVITTRKIQFVRRVPIDTHFTYNAVSGKLIPREIVTIPIFAGSEMVAIISMASVRKYSTQITQLIYRTYDVLNARVNGILAYRELRKSWKQLEMQKDELMAQSTELSRQNAELESQKNQLREASQLKTTFLSNMSHELRTPLNSVIALSGVLNRRLVNQIPDEEYSYLEVIERNGKHLLSLINDILDISRIEAGREDVEVSTFHPDFAIAEIISMLSMQANQKQIELIHLPVNHEIQIISDAKKLKHILQNLIANAVKFTEKGKVEVRIIDSNSHIDIQVADTGIGISEENQQHIFEEFRQADGSTSRKYGGTGLGLAIARRYASLLGGRITVQSELGKGSVFTLSLPKTLANKSADHSELNSFEQVVVDTSIEPLSGKGKTILLVDDSEPAIIQIRYFLEESNYKVLVADSGAKALKIVDDERPDAIVLDLMMPEVDGFEVLRVLREEESTASIPVLILTAKHITKDDLRFLKRNNVQQLIHKGVVNRNELLQSIQNMIHPKVQTEKLEKPVSKRVSKSSKPRVLIVEDNEDNMTTVKAIINDKYIVYEAYDGVEAVQKARETKPDFILMDIALPEMDGIEAFKLIRADVHLSKIPVLALTASAMTSDREAILAHGFDAYLVKPIDDTEFFNTINQVLYGK